MRSGHTRRTSPNSVRSQPRMPLFRDRPALLAGFREGRRDDLETVYRAFVTSVDRYLRALARDIGSGELSRTGTIADLVQEVFSRAFSESGRRGYDGRRDYGPYLRTIARNCFIDLRRARGREVLTNLEELSVALDDASADQEAWCEPKLFAVLNAYVEELRPAARRVYEQRYVLGRSQAQASTALGLSPRVIRTVEHHLRGGLRKALVRSGISLRELGPGRAYPGRTSPPHGRAVKRH
jgi:RNA polymerase sigma factor (sigma-70 family)